MDYDSCIVRVIVFSVLIVVRPEKNAHSAYAAKMEGVSINRREISKLLSPVKCLNVFELLSTTQSGAPLSFLFNTLLLLTIGLVKEKDQFKFMFEEGNAVCASVHNHKLLRLSEVSIVSTPSFGRRYLLQLLGSKTNTVQCSSN
jgi:hypothetical protein